MVRYSFLLILALLLSSCYFVSNKGYLKPSQINTNKSPLYNGYYYSTFIENKDTLISPILFIYFQDGYFKSEIYDYLSSKSKYYLQTKNIRNKDSLLKKMDSYVLHLKANSQKKTILKGPLINLWGRYTMRGDTLIMRSFTESRNKNYYVVEHIAINNLEERSITFYKGYDFYFKRNFEWERIYFFRELDSISLKVPDELKKLGNHQK
jgi:hypothetical protein